MRIINRKTALDVATWVGFMLVATSMIIVAICLPEISETFSTGYSEGGGMETAKSLVVLVVLLLAGILAQRWGKKRFLVLGQYFIAAGLLLGSFAQNYPTLILAVMMMGVGGGFSEALLNPLVVDIHPRQSGKYLNLSHAFYPVGIMGSALIFGELLTLGYSWRFIFQIAAVGALLVAVYTTVLRFPPSEKDDSSYPKLFARILRLWGFWLFATAIFLGAGIEAALTFWTRSYVETYLSDVPRSGAIAVVIFAASMAFGRFLTAYLANKISLNSIMIGSAVLGVGVSVLIPLATNLYWFYGLVGLAGLAVACFWPTILAEADNFLPVNTTILMVLLGSVGIVGFGLTPWIMGMIGDSAELRAGFVLIPLFFIGLIVVLVIERKLIQERVKQLETVEAKSPV
jgi:fucose permease